MRQERRRFPRIPIYLEVRAKHDDRPLIKPRCFNISGGGTCLFLAERLLKGEAVEMEIDLSVPSVIAHGEVVWTKEIETIGNIFFQTGIRFTDMESAGKAKIENLARFYRWISPDIHCQSHLLK